MKKLLVAAAFFMSMAATIPASTVSAAQAGHNQRNGVHHVRPNDSWNNRHNDDRDYYRGWNGWNSNNGRNYPHKGICNWYWRSGDWRYDNRRYISERRAVQIARCVFPHKRVVDVDLEWNRHGVRVYEVRFSNGHRVDVRANNGKVLTVYRGWSNNWNNNWNYNLN